MLKPNEASDKSVVDGHKRGKGHWGNPTGKVFAGGTDFGSKDKKGLEKDKAKFQEEKQKAMSDFKAHTDEVTQKLSEEREALEADKVTLQEEKDKKPEVKPSS